MNWRTWKQKTSRTVQGLRYFCTASYLAQVSWMLGEDTRLLNHKFKCLLFTVISYWYLGQFSHPSSHRAKWRGSDDACTRSGECHQRKPCVQGPDSFLTDSNMPICYSRKRHYLCLPRLLSRKFPWRNNAEQKAVRVSLHPTGRNARELWRRVSW